jgi:hypothetical protein
MSAPPFVSPDWRRWYQLERWRRRRRRQLRDHPVCKMCLAHGVATVATIADHVVSHQGDWQQFIHGDLQSLCAKCHNRHKRNLDQRGWTPDVDASGWPVDPRHPVNVKRN